MIIGVTGRIASGKGILTGYLLDLGFKHLSLSQEVREEAIRKGISITRESLQNLGNEFRNTYGAGIWAKKIVEKINSESYPNWVIEGIRNPSEIEELKKLNNFFLISIDAPQKERFERMLRRGKPSDPRVWGEFLKADERDFKEKDLSGQQVARCMEVADFNIVNNGSLEEMNSQIEKVHNKIKDIKR